MGIKIAMYTRELARRSKLAANRVLGRRGLSAAKWAVGTVRQALCYGRRFECPVCGSHLRRMLYLIEHSRDATCPVCRCPARHRWLWLVLREKGLLPGPGAKVLHIAPEWAIERKLRAALGPGYLSVDLLPARAMAQMDITASGCADATYDLIICSHVLDLIPDDGLAMREMFRILRPGGVFLVQVAMHGGPVTREDPLCVTPAQRQATYGQGDKLRLYGGDLADRLRGAGFHVEVLDPQTALSPADFDRYAMVDSTPTWATQSRMYVGRKR